MGTVMSGEAQPLVSDSGVRVHSPSAARAAGTTVCLILAGVLGLLFLVGALQCSFVVEPGTVGVVATLGHVHTYEPGLHFRAPYVSNVVHMSVKTQLLEQANVIPTKEGLSVELDTAMLYRIDPSKAGQLYMDVGSDFKTVLIQPEAASVVRGFTSESEAKALYTGGRSAIQDEVLEEVQHRLGPRGIIVEAVLLKDIGLPDQLSKAIEDKMQAEQEAARMEFVLKKERQEAERKAIEAQGIADFQRIVSEGISEELLK
uniref:Prohibitin n=2 Tax=Odontella aurita TaxID=265563 RepID=A0A7S4I7M2_9STRA|mmetsp:Transcript_20891/g.60815  ORF Transcript_20891/g.60815 Transcript_20891/m.60815 type:complete len:259 (+) Transcript_20891:309-1085(+)|eukprot:CAMPEP_0113552324 /NCGR_PEP_ID=MMETSP0015_2-20120614/15007_1 /TAXON_ID=2838 /ORGANISM="Odontella" /LENGTH=258 /DNA_ID=CAMNT_0000453295 /DNA_START=262 /DNA_END=1038 /DNA_ORIENTATION=- /assembly_acc=CAM_ASM_000160